MTFSALKRKIKIAKGKAPRLHGEGGKMHKKTVTAAECRVTENSGRYAETEFAYLIIKGAV